ncbi:TolC family protein [Puteibacter caeruleilacunae]|nr:TolC family protein [Puteibacter caeruleilacunae]
MNKVVVTIFFVITGLLAGEKSSGQNVLSLEEVLVLAKEYSLEYQESKNAFLADYWAYKEFKLNLLPKINLNTTPVSAQRRLTERYDFENNVDIYRENKSISSNAGLTVSQALPFSGGSISISSNLSRSQNFGMQDYTVFSSTPFRISLSQPLFAFNSYKWDKQELPIKLKKAKRKLIQAEQQLNQQVAKLYFNLVKSFQLHKLAQKEDANSDSLLIQGKALLKLHEITPLELKEIQLKKTNAQINLDKRQQSLIDAQFQLNKLLRGHLPKNFIPSILKNIPAVELNATEILEKVQSRNPFYLDIAQQKIDMQRQLAQAKKQDKLNASLNLSYGLNQQGENFGAAYKSPLDQQSGSVSISIPLFKGGVNKGKLLLIQRNLEMEALKLEARVMDFEQQLSNKVLESIRDQNIFTNALQSRKLAQETYQMKQQQYQLGRMTLQELNLTHIEMLQAEENYLESVSNFWSNYYELQSLTLHDLIHDQPLQVDFEPLMKLL